METTAYMRLSIVIFIFSLTFNSIAQNNSSKIKRCGTDNYVANKIFNDSNYSKIVEQTRLMREEIGAGSANKRSQACPNGNLTIPVAVHFDDGIGTTPRERTCLLSLVNAQIRVLNEAFNGLNDSGCSTTPTNGACLTFKLGNQNHAPITGLQNGDPAITFDGAFTCPQATPCNVTYWGGYLNIVVQNMVDSGGPLGIAPLNGNPAGGSSSDNAILVDACAFGTEDIFCDQAGPYSCGAAFRYRSGYTTVHEAGHFYGLDHTFCSDDNGNPEGGEACSCSFSNCDGFSDTPVQCHSNYSCFSGTCSETIINPCGGTVIFNNFMDYLVDNCMNSFTNQQTTFMNDLADADSYKQALGDFAPDCDFLLRVDNEKRTVSESETLILCGSSDFIIEETVLNNPENYNWTFTTTNGLQVNINSSSQPNPVLRLSGNPGQLTVSLSASNANGTCSGTNKTYNIEPSLDFSANLSNVECLNNNIAGVELELGSTNGNVSFSPANLVTGSGTSSDPYLALVDLEDDCSPIAFTAFDEGLMIEKGILEILEPSNIAGSYEAGTNDATQFGVDMETVSPCIQGDIMLVNDGSGITTDFCQPEPPTQPTSSQCNNLNGNIALIDRGDCTFVSKIENAQACDAIAVIICNCEPFSENCIANSNTEILNMSGESNSINIPSIFISYNDCQLVKSSLNQEENVRVCIGAPRTGSCAQTVSINPCEISACSGNIVNGCTNPCAANFNPQATQNDGSCANFITANINSLPAFTLNDNSIQLSGSPAGGTFSGNGVVFSTFNASVVSIGMHTITYTYNNSNGCEVSAAKSILVSQLDYNFVEYQLDFISP